MNTVINVGLHKWTWIRWIVGRLSPSQGLCSSQSVSHFTECVLSCDITLPLVILLMMKPFLCHCLHFFWFNSATHFTSVIIVEVTFGWLFLWLLTIFTNRFLLTLCCSVDYLCFVQHVTSIFYRPLPFLNSHITYLCHFWVMHFTHDFKLSPCSECFMLSSG
jgi:hypothetical protein